ncbi:CUE domain protein [Rhizoctonia solani]|uniref:CUE domain protein n=1 Tax=Rhizoctonia solani TaxID=456999 RepID=A0A8H8SSC6_9AGAM|nr:CUE domain protein [Rhizoctonia solani]QRW15854.1 CUE domain protein [Rhizoctonia solani]
MIATGALSLVIGLADVRYYFHLQLSPHISRDHQYWRLLTNQLAFTNSSELLLGQIILYNVAVGIERTFGSHKYFSFLIAAALVSTLLNFSSLIALHRFGLNYIPAGPIAILFAIIYQYERLVPSAYNFRILGITMSNKAFTYLTAFPMVISHMPGSALVTLTGIATGALYRSDITNLKSYRAPPWFVSTISSLVGASRAPHMPRRAIPGERPPFSTEQVVTRRRVNEPREESDVRTDVNTANGTARAATGSSSGSVMREWVDELTGRRDGGRVPTAAEIAELTSVFPHASREEIISALQRSQSVDQAASILLTGSS